MSWELKLDEDLKLIFLTFFGKTTSKDILDASNARVDLVKDTGVTKLIIDVYELDADSKEVITIYDLVDKHYKKADINIKMKMAITTPKLTSANDMARFYETMCLNRGHDCRQFENRDDAIEWLRNE